MRGFAEGAMLVMVLSSIGMLFLLHTEGLQQLAGAHGEGFTATQLAKAKKHGYVWGAVANVELADGDIDSIVLAPRGVIAIDSKWRFRDLDRRYLNADLEKARKAARKARSVLRSQPVGQVMDVTPLLVVWGKGGRSVAAGGEVHGEVHLVDGAELVDWLAAWGTGPLPQDHAEKILAALTRFAETHGPQSQLTNARPSRSSAR